MTKNKQLELNLEADKDFYFWLGGDEQLEAVEMTKEEFDAKQEVGRKNLEDFLNCRVPRGE